MPAGQLANRGNLAHPFAHPDDLTGLSDHRRLTHWIDLSEEIPSHSAAMSSPAWAIACDIASPRKYAPQANPAHMIANSSAYSASMTPA